MGFKSNQINYIIETLLRIDPSLKKDDLLYDKVESIVKEKIKDPTVILDNNVINENHEISLIKLCNWIDNKIPVVSGNATFYCQPTELLSPTANMLRSLKKGRKSVKKEMFKYKEGSDKYKILDLDQMNKKVIMNAEYGGSGAPTAAFYTKYSPAATTLMAQSIITIMASFFESFIGDNQKFYHIDECFDWMNTVIEKDEKIPTWVKNHTSEELYKRLLKHFMIINIDEMKILKMYIDNLNQQEIDYLYYANNLNEFIYDHQKIQNIIFNILNKLPRYSAVLDDVPSEFKDKFSSADVNENILKYNRWVSEEMFLNPYNVPEIIKDDMDKLCNILFQMIYVKYLTPDSIMKLNNHKRNTVLLVDTDSNMINADLFVSFILKEIINQDFGRETMYNEMILCNILAVILDKPVKTMLDYYGIRHNMDKESREELVMKNEFMFRRFILMKTKKRYVSSVLLREGNIMMPMYTDIKGMDFIKAGVSDAVEKRFKTMLEKNLLFSDKINAHGLMKDIKQFEKDIYQDLKNGSTTYLKQQQFKDGGYKNMATAWSAPVFKGTMIWNELYPDRKIYGFDKVGILKTIIAKPEDIEILKEKYPNEYDLVLKNIYMSTDSDIRNAGLKYIAIPITSQGIPKWMLSITDFDIIISDVISSFRSVTDALRVENTEFKTPNGKGIITSCLISL